MFARARFGMAVLFLGTVAACGGGGSGDIGADAAMPPTTTYFSCDEIYGVGDQTMHVCLEYSQEMPFAAPSASQCPPATNGFMGTPGDGFSLTKRCSKKKPGCVCVYDERGTHHEKSHYQIASQDAYQNAVRECESVAPAGTVSCFGGLTVPADAGAF
jgi:hypothetical protein